MKWQSGGFLLRLESAQSDFFGLLPLFHDFCGPFSAPIAFYEIGGSAPTLYTHPFDVRGKHVQQGPFGDPVCRFDNSPHGRRAWRRRPSRAARLKPWHRARWRGALKHLTLVVSEIPPAVVRESIRWRIQVGIVGMPLPSQRRFQLLLRQECPGGLGMFVDHSLQVLRCFFRQRFHPASLLEVGAGA